MCGRIRAGSSTRGDRKVLVVRSVRRSARTHTMRVLASRSSPRAIYHSSFRRAGAVIRRPRHDEQQVRHRLT